jgi:hypothetical protein
MQYDIRSAISFDTKYSYLKYIRTKANGVAKIKEHWKYMNCKLEDILQLFKCK